MCPLPSVPRLQIEDFRPESLALILHSRSVRQSDGYLQLTCGVIRPEAFALFRASIPGNALRWTQPDRDCVIHEGTTAFGSGRCPCSLHENRRPRPRPPIKVRGQSPVAAMWLRRETAARWENCSRRRFYQPGCRAGWDRSVIHSLNSESGVRVDHEKSVYAVAVIAHCMHSRQGDRGSLTAAGRRLTAGFGARRRTGRQAGRQPAKAREGEDTIIEPCSWLCASRGLSVPSCSCNCGKRSCGVLGRFGAWQHPHAARPLHWIARSMARIV